MPDSKDSKKTPQIHYSCYYSRTREGEQFVPEHVFSYQISGALILNDGQKVITFQPGDFRFVRKNSLVKFTKQPPENGEFRSISVYLDQDSLRNFSMEYDWKAEKEPETHDAVIPLRPDPLLVSYITSLIPYQKPQQIHPLTQEEEAKWNQLIHAGQRYGQTDGLLSLSPTDEQTKKTIAGEQAQTGMAVAQSQAGISDLLQLKLKEAILLLVRTNPGLKDILFDFTEPGKIDLEEFMNRNYHFNVEMKRFAYLTGRSLATFKRDFEKVFHNTPSRWLQQKRLKEAYYLIKKKGQSPSDVYLDLGFENFSHFSYAFKKAYGVPPSKV